MWKKIWYSRTDHTWQYGARAMHAGLLRLHVRTHTHKHTLTICNTHCFSTTTMVARTGLNITLYVHCLCFSITRSYTPYINAVSSILNLRKCNIWWQRNFLISDAYERKIQNGHFISSLATQRCRIETSYPTEYPLKATLLGDTIKGTSCFNHWQSGGYVMYHQV